MATEKRLIDADDLQARFLVVAQSGGPVVVHVSDICKAIEDAAVYESVDAVEVVHGRWIEKEYVDEPYGVFYLFHCSECGVPNARERNYCPNCGAKMDGGDSNGL